MNSAARACRLAAFFSFACVFARPAEAELSKDKADAFADVLQSTDDSSLRDSSLSSLSGVAFEAGEENKQARLRWSKNTGTINFSTQLSVPVDEKEGRSVLADLDGLAKALSFAGSHTRYFTGNFPDTASQNAICDRLGLTQNDCDTQNAAEKGTLADLRAFGYASMTDKWTPFVTFEAKVGRQKVEYFSATATAVEKKDDSELPYAATIGGGWLTLNSVLILRAKFQKAVKEKDKVTFCETAEVDARTEDCATLPFGAPLLKSSTVFSVEWRTFLGCCALSPTVSHDTKTDETGIELPIYFLKNVDGQFTGGLRLSYETESDEPTASIFITKALSL